MSDLHGEWEEPGPREGTWLMQGTGFLERVTWELGTGEVPAGRWRPSRALWGKVAVPRPRCPSWDTRWQVQGLVTQGERAASVSCPPWQAIPEISTLPWFTLFTPLVCLLSIRATRDLLDDIVSGVTGWQGWGVENGLSLGRSYSHEGQVPWASFELSWWPRWAHITAPTPGTLTNVAWGGQADSAPGPPACTWVQAGA